MKKSTAIEFISVTKSFSRHTGRVLLSGHLRSLLGQKHRKERFYALKKISFRMDAGENVALVGTNGAGKSTLLSLAANLTQPDSGLVVVNGRVAALLQLGAGFHSDLTGAENIRLNAALLGLSRKRTGELFDRILDFAGLADFVDEPLRTYSSGMMMRLAFAVAVHVDPEVLIIDEVLAVGDHAFQAKCFEKILEFRAAGKTLLFVSHATGMVQEVCSRAIWLDQGELMMDGKIDDVIAAYEGRVPARAE